MTRDRSRDQLQESRKPEPGSTRGDSVDRDRVAGRAYEIYHARGREDGRDLADWLEAERELRDSYRNDER